MEVEAWYSPWIAIGVDAEDASIRQFNKCRVGCLELTLNDEDFNAEWRRRDTTDLQPRIGAFARDETSRNRGAI